jgi:hypothetical protein
MAAVVEQHFDIEEFMAKEQARTCFASPPRAAWTTASRR